MRLRWNFVLDPLNLNRIMLAEGSGDISIASLFVNIYPFPISGRGFLVLFKSFVFSLQRFS